MQDDGKTFDLEERTFQFALAVRNLIAACSWKTEQRTDVEQELRSSGSVAANYTGANSTISTADFSHRLKVSRKEASETRLCLRPLEATSTDERVPALRDLYREPDELTRILSTILRKLETKARPIPPSFDD